MARGFMSQPRVVLTGGIVYFFRRHILTHLRQSQGRNRAAMYFTQRQKRKRSMPIQGKVRHTPDGLIHRLSQSARDQAFIEAALAWAIVSRQPDNTMAASEI